MNRIKEVLEKKIRQRWLAEKIGKGFSQINAYADNHSLPNIEKSFEITKILRVGVKDLIIGMKQ